MSTNKSGIILQRPGSIHQFYNFSINLLVKAKLFENSVISALLYIVGISQAYRRHIAGISQA